MHDYSIGTASAMTGVSADTLRYYEKIGLLRPVARGPGGRRRYQEADLERLRFIRRGQRMNFRLSEIATLLELRDAPAGARPLVRALAAEKLEGIERHIAELNHMQGELRLLLQLCDGVRDCCPILEALSQSEPAGADISKRAPAGRARSRSRPKRPAS